MSELARRRKVFHVTADLLLNLSSGVFEVVDRPLPRDARAVGGGFDHQTGTIVVVVESGEFPEVEPGCVLQQVESPLIRRLGMAECL